MKKDNLCFDINYGNFKEKLYYDIIFQYYNEPILFSLKNENGDRLFICLTLKESSLEDDSKRWIIRETKEVLTSEKSYDEFKYYSFNELFSVKNNEYDVYLVEEDDYGGYIISSVKSYTDDFSIIETEAI